MYCMIIYVYMCMYACTCMYADLYRGDYIFSDIGHTNYRLDSV